MGGMTGRRPAEVAAGTLPQWSPPVMGGMTRTQAVIRYVKVAAAMEPARNGRDDSPSRSASSA